MTGSPDGIVVAGTGAARGCLAGLRVLEVGGIGAAPLCAMLLADHGADVLRLERAAVREDGGEYDGGALLRGRARVIVDLKQAQGREALLRLADTADVLLEAFRPGVAERMGFGPEPCMQRNPKLVYARLTGWGQQGPRALEPGHDLNFLAVSGVLGLMGREDSPPTPPLNLVGDGGTAFLTAFGIMAALFERDRSGCGQVVDAAMVDGAALLATPFFGYAGKGLWGPRGTNIVDGGAPFYDAYRSADDRWVAVAAVEPRFYEDLLRVLGLDPKDLPSQYDRAGWATLRTRFAAAFRTATQQEWCERARGSNACLTPVLTQGELAADPQLASRGTFTAVDGSPEPAPAPRFSRTPAAPGTAPRDGFDALRAWGLPAAQIDSLAASGVLRPAPRNHIEEYT